MRLAGPMLVVLIAMPSAVGLAGCLLATELDGLSGGAGAVAGTPDAANAADAVDAPDAASPPAVDGSVVAEASVDGGATRIEGETMTVAPPNGPHEDPLASGGKTMVLWVASAATATFRGTATRITIRWRGSACDGSAHAAVALDGVTVSDTDVPTQYVEHHVDSALPDAMHTLQIQLTNDYAKGGGSGCDRNLFVDAIVVTS